MFKTYDVVIKKFLSDNSEDTNWKKILETHHLMIERIQHERLIHLLVTIFVGIVLIFSILATVITEKMLLIYLDIPLLILFTAYIFHYRFLENTTQNWYKLEDEIREYN
jgi:ACR3 family arsenite efflux pump ArsB